MGVHWCNHYKKWTVMIRVGKDKKYITRTSDFQTAVLARMDAEKKYGYHENHGKVI